METFSPRGPRLQYRYNIAFGHGSAGVETTKLK